MGEVISRFGIDVSDGGDRLCNLRGGEGLPSLELSDISMTSMLLFLEADEYVVG